jgi:hypothetical protein
MGRISTYTNASPVTLSDKFIGTEVAGTPTNVTKNFLVSDLLTLFQSNITLQNVLDAGNTATQSIILTGDITQVGAYNYSGGEFSIGATGVMALGGTVKDFNGALGVNGETLVCNASGQLVFGSGLTNQNLQQVLDIGNTATQDIGLTGNLTLIGDPDITGDLTHSGNYLFETGQFTFNGTSSVLLQGAIKDSANTVGGNGQILVSNASGQVTWQNDVPTTVRTSTLTTTNLILADANGVVITDTSAITSVRIPTNAGSAYELGTEITIIQDGVGVVTVVPTAGVTLKSAQGHDRLKHQYSVATVVKTATDSWYMYGDIQA